MPRFLDSSYVGRLTLAIRSWWTRQRLHVQVALLGSAVIAVTLSISTAISIDEQTRAALEKLKATASTLADNIAVNATGPIIADDLADLEDLLLKSAEFPDVTAARIVDTQGHNLGWVHREPDKTMRVVFDLTLYADLPSSVGGIRRIIVEDDRLTVWRRIDSADTLAWLRLDYSLGPLRELQSLIWRENVGSSTLAIIVDLIVLLLIMRRPMRSLRRATKFASQLTPDADQRLILRPSSREVDTLIVALNATANRLESQHAELARRKAEAEASAEQLEAARATLEQRVEQRTKELSWHATHDALTGLANRFEFERQLQAALETARSKEKHHALCFMDLDQFKLVNDSAGHVAGDELLRQIALLLRSKLREADTLARLGGDEFGALLEGCSTTEAQRLARELVVAVRGHRYVWNDKSFSLGLSVGIVIIDGTNDDLTELVSNADMACYVAKERRDDCVHLYEPDDTELTQRRGEIRWIANLNKALTENKLRLYQQTIVPLAASETGELHCELLVRLEADDGSVVPAHAFLPAAERYRLTPTIDRWVFGTLCTYLHEKHATGSDTERNVIYTVNVSGQSLGDPSFLEYVANTMRTSGVPGPNFCFEITETAAIANLPRALHFIRELKKLGCRFALDDFGTGLSSFSYLKSLPVDYIKIDGSFIRDMLTDPLTLAIIESINTLSHAFGFKTIAEYVDQRGMLEKLHAIGVNYVQGYHISHPVPLETNAA